MKKTPKKKSPKKAGHPAHPVAPAGPVHSPSPEKEEAAPKAKAAPYADFNSRYAKAIALIVPQKRHTNDQARVEWIAHVEEMTGKKIKP